MRRDILHIGSGQLSYEIREIATVARELEKLGLNITWENLGDPIKKGEKIPDWIKKIIVELTSSDNTYGYVASHGIVKTRQFLADEVNKEQGYNLTIDDIVFFNGLGDAVAKIFGFLKREARVIGPSPAYSTYSSAEAAHSGYDHLTYNLDHDNLWLPDLDDLEKKIKYNDSIAGLLIVNPGNPTGAVCPKSVLQEMVNLAIKYDLFIICSEIYTNIIYNGSDTVRINKIIGDVPGIALRSISKELPWPGARCGWIEIFNQDRYPVFKTYIKTIKDAKMLEVCSSSLPQYAIPKIMGDPRYQEHLKNRNKMFEQRVNEAKQIFSGLKGIKFIKPRGAFYLSLLFEGNILNYNQTLDIPNPKVKQFIEEKVKGVGLDKRFAYYLLGATGICVVPLTGFCCSQYGFRMTLLEADNAKRKWIFNTIAQSIKEYIQSASNC